jgi:hypothetical protein
VLARAAHLLELAEHLLELTAFAGGRLVGGSWTRLCCVARPDVGVRPGGETFRALESGRA